MRVNAIQNIRMAWRQTIYYFLETKNLCLWVILWKVLFLFLFFARRQEKLSFYHFSSPYFHDSFECPLPLCYSSFIINFHGIVCKHKFFRKVKKSGKWTEKLINLLFFLFLLSLSLSSSRYVFTWKSCSLQAFHIFE